MSLAEAFASIATGFSAMGLGPFVAGKVVTQSGVVFDDGGSIVDSGDPTDSDCMVQVDAVTEAMRAQDGFAEGDARLMVIQFTGAITTDDAVEVLTGPDAGTWSVQSVATDPVNVGFEIRGRRV